MQISIPVKIEVSGKPGIDLKMAANSSLFEKWLEELDPKYVLISVEFLSLCTSNSAVESLEFDATVIVNSKTEILSARLHTLAEVILTRIGKFEAKITGVPGINLEKTIDSPSFQLWIKILNPKHRCWGVHFLTASIRNDFMWYLWFFADVRNEKDENISNTVVVRDFHSRIEISQY